MAGYIRQDTTDQIANGQVIDAVYLDQEFNALEAAFSVVSGHNHDGTTGEGAPITVVGPAQDVVVSATNVLPKTTNVYDLGSPTFKFKDAYVDGVLYVDGINYNGTAITATAAELNFVDGVTSSIQTQIDAINASLSAPPDAELSAIAGLTSAADTVPYFTGSGTAALATFTSFGRNLVDDADAAAGRTTLGLAGMATQAPSSVTITGGSITGLSALTSSTATLTSATISGGSITGITDLAVADGGTGVSALTGIVKGNGTSPFSAAVAGTDYLAPAAIGTDVQAYNANLASLSGLTLAADRSLYSTGANTLALFTLTSAGRALLDDADAAAQRTTLGLGGLATLNILDEDDFATNSATRPPSQQSTKAYVDTAVAAVSNDIFFRLNSAHAGANDTSAQNLFPQAVTLEANTVYEYEIFWSISKTAGGTSHTLSTGFGGTATLNNIQRNFAFNGSTTLTYAASFTSAGYLLTANSTLFANAVANVTVHYWNSERGTVSINGAGTFIPQYTLSAAPGGAYSTNIGSYFRLRRLGASGSNLSSGSWA